MTGWSDTKVIGTLASERTLAAYSLPNQASRLYRPLLGHNDQLLGKKLARQKRTTDLSEKSATAGVAVPFPGQLCLSRSGTK